MATIQNDDLFLVGRGTKSYKIQAKDLLKSPVTIDDSAPVDPNEGDLWWADTDIDNGGGRLYIYTGSEWIDVSINDAVNSITISETAPEVDTPGVLWWADNDLIDGGGRLYVWTGDEWIDISLIGSTDIEDNVVGTIDTPTVLAPKDGAGSGDARNAVSDTITKVEGAGENTYTTDTIESVSSPPTTYQIKGFGSNVADNDGKSKADALATSWNSAGEVLETVTFGAPETFNEYRQAQLYDFIQPISHSYFTVNHAASVSSVYEIWGTNDPTSGFTELLDRKTTMKRDDPDFWLDSGSTPYRYIMFMGNFDGSGDPQGLYVKNYGLKDTFVPSDTLLTFPTDNNFDKFEVGEVVQDPDVKITDIDAAGPTITVDGGSWKGADGTGDAGDGRYEPHQEWSSKVVNTGTGVNGGPISVAFNGTVGPGAGDERVAPSLGESLTLPITGSTGNTTVEIVGSFTGTTGVLEINGTPVSTPNTGAPVTNTYTSTEVPSLATGVQSIKWNYVTVSQYLYLQGIYINGNLLVDSSVPGGAGDTNLSKTAAYNTKLTVAGDQDLVDMSGAVFMTDGQTNADGSYKPASYTPVTNTIASVGPLDTGTTYSGQGSQGDGDTSAGREIQTNYLCLLGGAGYTSTAYNNLSATSYIKFDTPIVLGKPSTITIEANGNAGGWVTLNPATYDNNAIPQTAGYTNFANMIGESWETITFPEQVTVIEGVRWNGVNAGWTNQISNMLIDGAPINPERSTLTFESPNPDLQYFREGDVVQGAAPEGVAKWTEASSSGAIPLSDFNNDASLAVMDPYVVGGQYAGQSGLVFHATNYLKLNTPRTSVTFNYHAPTGWIGNNSTFQGSVSNDGVNWITANSGPLPLEIQSGGSQWTYFALQNAIMGSGEPTDSYYAWFYDDSAQVKVISTGYPDSNTMVVDGGSWYGASDGSGDADGETVVTGPTNTAEGTFLSYDAVGDGSYAVDLSASSGRWIADNTGGIDFSIAGPQIVDNPLLTADVELLSSNFATEPSGSDTLNNIVWELNGVTQDAATTNPYKPTLSTDTTYTVRVKHQGNELPESQWSTSTTFTTGSTRNLYTYLQDRIQTLITRIETLEADHTS